MEVEEVVVVEKTEKTKKCIPYEDLTRVYGSRWPKFIAVGPWGGDPIVFDNGEEYGSGFAGFETEQELEGFIAYNPSFRVFRLGNRWFLDD
jgi:hypothetical protein